jgi:CubicO group peptidase (beta-lactamase class C family)
VESLKSFVEKHREIWEVPGCAVGAVKEDEIVLNEGFGLRDVGAGTPADNKTLFAIGSTTKAFTAAAVGAMVDDGLIDWDKPVRDYMPGFQLHDPVATERVTPLDLLSHRTGLPRHEFSWMASPEKSRAELVAQLKHLPLSRDIRQVFQYCNLGYLTAGYLIEVVTGMTWEEYVSTRLLKPLGMDDTNFSVGDMTRGANFSKPHERRGESVIEIPFRVIDQTGPAGSINSSTTDMINWLRVNLSKGKFGDSEVISPATVRRMQSPQMVTGGFGGGMDSEIKSFAYGLGLMVGEYRGHRLIQHGGGIDGFLTEFMFAPDDGIGVVVLTNSTSSSLGPVISYRVLDELLELEPIDWQTRIKERRDQAQGGAKEARAAAKRKNTPIPRPLDEYAGDYDHPGYGRFTISVDGDKLVPKFGTLKIELVHRHYEVFDLEWRELTEDVTIFPLTFLTSPEGDISSLTVPFEASVDPIKFDRQPDALGSDPAVLRNLTGTYVMGPIELVVELKGEDTLTVSAMGQPGQELEPTRGLRFEPKGARGAASVEFVLAEDGSVEKVVIQPTGVFTPKTED